MRAGWLKFAVFIGWIITSSIATQAQPADKNFLESINEPSDGSSFEQAIVLNDICDYSQCEDKTCLIKVFNKTIWSQELEYINKKYGRPETDWELVGQSEIQAYGHGFSSYYDDVGLRIVAEGKDKVIHFDITGPFNALSHQEYYSP